MGSRLPVIYHIDHEGRLTGFNDGWSAFAAANEGAGLEPAELLGRSLWDFLADLATIHLYQEMVARLRPGGPAIRFQFRCDAPRTRRLLGMEITREEDTSVRFVVTPVRDETRAPVPLREGGAARDGGLLVMCGWCKRVRMEETRWVEIEEAIRALGVFGDVPLPGVTHGMCLPCEQSVRGLLDEEATGAAPLVSLGTLPTE